MQVTEDIRRAVVLFTADWLSERHQGTNVEFKVLFNELYVTTMDAGTQMLLDFYDGKRKTKPTEMATAKAQMAQNQQNSGSLIDDYFNDSHKAEWMVDISQPNSLQKYL